LIHNLINRPQSTSLLLYDAIWYLACPARFERATYALEEFLAAGNSNKFNGLSQKTSTVQQTVQRVLSGKPTF
jgi:hypothetical protein